MSNRSKYELNEKKIKPLINRYREKRKELKKQIKDESISHIEKLKIIGQLHNLPRRSSATRLNSRCNKSYVSRSVDRFTGLNMFQLRLLASTGKLPGFVKATW